MEIVAAVELCRFPVEAGLVLVMVRAELGEHALAIGRDNGVEVGAEIRARVLGENRRRGAGTIDGDGVGGWIGPDAQGSGVDGG